MDPSHSMNPELAKAVKIVLKYEIQALLSRLAETGEESLVIVASTDEGTYGHLGSNKGEGFLMLSQLDNVKKEFLSFCSAPSATSDPVVPKMDVTRPFRPHRRKSVPRCKSEPRSLDFEMHSRVGSLVDRIPESSMEDCSVDQIPNTNIGRVDEIPAELESSTALDLSGNSVSESVNGHTDSNMPCQLAGYTWVTDKNIDVKHEYIDTEDNTIDTSNLLNNSATNCTGKSMLESLAVLSSNNMTMAFRESPTSQYCTSKNRRKINSKMFPRQIQEKGKLANIHTIGKNAPETGTHDTSETVSEISLAGTQGQFENSTTRIEADIHESFPNSSLHITPERSPSIDIHRPKSDLNDSIFEEHLIKPENQSDLFVLIKKEKDEYLPPETESPILNSSVLMNMKSAFVDMGNMARCLLCNKILQRNNRTFHWRSHVGDKRYKCDVCNKAFTHPSNMRSHRKIHTDEKPFQCDLCERAFRRRDYLLQHLEKSHHGSRSDEQCSL